MRGGVANVRPGAVTEAAEGARPSTTVSVTAIGSHSAASPSFAVRVIAPSEELRKHGVEIEPLTLFTVSEETAFSEGSPLRKWQITSTARRRLAARLQVLGPETETVLIQRQADVLATLAIEQRALKSRRLVYDLDDAIWLDGPGANGSVFAFLKGSRRKVEWLARRSDHALVGNQYLADYLERFAQRVTIVPSLVDIADYPLREHSNETVFTVGWIGSRTTAPYLDAITPLLERVAGRLKPRRLLLLTVGGVTTPPRGVDSEALPWTPQNQRLALKRIDVGIMPQPNRPWVLGKSAYKALQYMASGIPVVADDVGVAGARIGAGGRVVGAHEEWTEALVTLASDSALRARVGAEGRRHVAREYSFERWVPVLADILRGE
jgi:hypothetical protein